MYKSFRVKNFRCFKDLRINDLGRVNLIAGKNNTGKTALLEAALVLTCPLSPNLLLDLLTSRGFIDSGKNRRDLWQQIFYGLDTTREINLSGAELVGRRHVGQERLQRRQSLPPPAPESGEFQGYGFARPEKLMRAT